MNLFTHILDTQFKKLGEFGFFLFIHLKYILKDNVKELLKGKKIKIKIFRFERIVFEMHEIIGG